MEKKQKDIYIKDKGDFVLVIAQTDKAKNIVDNDAALQESCKEQGQDPKRFVIPTGEAYKVLTYAVSHGLTIETEVPMTVPSKPIKRNKE